MLAKARTHLIVIIFITSSNMDIDVINISETSQKLNESFNSNLSIESYTRPFTTGSKFSKGGVAIYAKENLNVIERDDLKEISDSFEIIWIEINMDNRHSFNVSVPLKVFVLSFFLHSILFVGSALDSFQCLKSLLIVSFHVFFGLPRPRCPTTSNSVML